MGNFVDYSKDGDDFEYGGVHINSPKPQPGRTVNQLLKMMLLFLAAAIMLGLAAVCVFIIVVIASMP